MSWPLVNFLEVVFDATGGNPKIKSGDYLLSGLLPVIDQGKKQIGGYINETQLACKVPAPVVVFGDHTKKVKFIDYPFALGADGIKVLKPLGASLDEKYLYYFLRNARLPDDAGYSRHFKFVKRLKIPLPPLEEQKRIAAILDKADAIRRKRQKAIALTDTLLKSVFLDMFGDPVTNPKGWEVSPLIELCAEKIGIKAGPFGSALKKEDYKEEGYRVYGQEQVIAQDLEHGDYYISESKFEKLKSCAVKHDDLLISLVGSIGRILIVPKSFEPGIINPRLVRMRVKKDTIIPEFLTSLFSQLQYQKYVASFSHGGTMPILNASILKSLMIPVPPLVD